MMRVLFARWERVDLSWRMLWMFLLFELIVAGRVCLEMRILTDNASMIVAIHRYLWYTYVFLFFAVCYRRLLHAPFEKLMYLSLGGVILFIPPLYAVLAGHPFKLNYLVSRDPLEIARELLTLHYGHEQNFLMFPELLTLLIGTIAISWYFSRRIGKTMLNTLVAFYGAFLTAGLCWFSVNPKHEAVFRFTAMFRPQQFYALQFLSLSLVLIVLLFLPEIRARMRVLFTVRVSLAILSFGALLFLFFRFFTVPRYGRPLTAVDIVAVALPLVFTAMMPIVFRSRVIPSAGRLLAAYYAVISLAVVFAAHVMDLRF